MIEVFGRRPRKAPPLQPGEKTSQPRPAYIQTEGSLLARQAQRLPQHPSALGPYVLTPQGGTLVLVGQRLIVKLTPLDASLGPLPAIIKALRPYSSS